MRSMGSFLIGHHNDSDTVRRETSWSSMQTVATPFWNVIYYFNIRFGSENDAARGISGAFGRHSQLMETVALHCSPCTIIYLFVYIFAHVSLLTIVRFEIHVQHIPYDCVVSASRNTTMHSCYFNRNAAEIKWIAANGRLNEYSQHH